LPKSEAEPSEYATGSRKVKKRTKKLAERETCDGKRQPGGAGFAFVELRRREMDIFNACVISPPRPHFQLQERNIPKQ
jgi:hypothetical protein